MIRSLSFIFSLSVFMSLNALPLSAQTQSAGAPLCVYDSKDYSDGAFICVQKSLMLNCSADGTKATWKIVDDKDINARCIAPIARTAESMLRPRYRRTAMRPPVFRAADPNAKCFHFNGKRYCE